MEHVDSFKKLGISRYATDKYFEVVNSSRRASQKNLANLLYKSIGIMIVTLQKVDSILHNMLILQRLLSNVKVGVDIDMQLVLEEYKRNKQKLIDRYIDKPNIPNKTMKKYIDSVTENGIVTSKQGEILHYYRDLRNQYVHKAFVIEPRKLLNSKDIKSSISDITAITIILGDFTETLTYKNIEKIFGTSEAVEFFKGVSDDAIEKMRD